MKQIYSVFSSHWPTAMPVEEVAIRRAVCNLLIIICAIKSLSHLQIVTNSQI